MKRREKKVFIGLSGGVDSAVSAGLLLRAGYEVTGVFIKVWQPNWIECGWKAERRDAMRVAARLGIPFFTLDLEKEYKESVIDYMILEYKNGRTPNPDVMCNREIKFGAFWRWAKARGADFIATGHYARAQAGAAQNKCLLLAGIDSSKDQSYFLWTLNQDDLEHILFPVGDLTKPEVRQLAEKFKLPNASKKDSQGLCFVGKINIKEFLSHYIEFQPGNVLDKNGEIIGRHPGALFFTIGERHGFTVTKKTPNEERFFVIDKDMEQNTITVSDRTHNNQSRFPAEKTARLTRVNWISGGTWDYSSAMKLRKNDNEYPLQARIRYRQPLQNIKIVSVNISEVMIELENSQDSLTPGQSLVIYDGEECVGGGIIE
jgi:tRNA-specific 2-thiouridylase